MNNKKIKIFISIILLFFGLVIGNILTTDQTFADCKDGYAETAFLGCVESKSGCGVFMTINIILTVITSGVAVLGVLGIVIAAIMYASARDNETQVAKAKKRIFEVVIGLALWVFLFIISQFLLPGGFANQTQTCKIIAPMTAEEVAARNKKLAKKAKDGAKVREPKYEDEDGSNASQYGANAQGVIKLAKEYTSSTSKYKKAAKKVGVTRANGGMACGCFAATVIRTLGIDKNIPDSSVKIYPYLKKHSSKWHQRARGIDNCQPGDIMLQLENGKGRHTALVVEKNGKKAQAEASYMTSWPKLRSGLHSYGRSVVCFYPN